MLAYLGSQVLLSDIIIKPVNSMIKQSLHARESIIPTNGDGFGLGWYNPEVDRSPALFTSVFPAWNDRNFLNIATKIKSSCFFSHIRAASVGSVSIYNCHPFVFKNWMMMHNGSIENFSKIKRHMRRLLDDDLYDWINGDTDTEHLFALVLQIARDFHNHGDIHVLYNILIETLKQVDFLLKTHVGGSNDSVYNLCFSDGERLIASRYSANPLLVPESMHVMTGNNFEAMNEFKGPIANINHQSVLVASEKLTDNSAAWLDVPINHALLIDSDHLLHFKEMPTF